MLTVLWTIIAVLAFSWVLLFIFYRRSLREDAKKEAGLEVRDEVIKNVKKANKARERVKSDSGYRRKLRKKYTRK